MLKLAAVLQQKQALLGEGFLMDRLKQSLTGIKSLVYEGKEIRFPLIPLDERMLLLSM